MNADKWCRRSRYKYTSLVDSVVCGVELTELLERCLREGEEKCWRYSLVDRVLGNID